GPPPPGGVRPAAPGRRPADGRARPRRPAAAGFPAALESVRGPGLARVLVAPARSRRHRFGSDRDVLGPRRLLAPSGGAGGPWDRFGGDLPLPESPHVRGAASRSA